MIRGGVRIDGRVIRNTKCMEEFRFRWKESEFVGSNQDLLVAL
jgi:hypothetical protein